MDSDIDEILVIVRVDFLVVAPVRTWPRTFQGAEAEAELFFWGMLLLAGLIYVELASLASIHSFHSRFNH